MFKKFFYIISKFCLATISVIIVPVVFGFFWLMTGHIEWKNIIKLTETQLQKTMPGYVIKADSVLTEGFDLGSFGVIYLRVNNFLFDDTINHTIKIKIENALLSFSIKDLIFGSFLPIIQNAEKLNVLIDLDSIALRDNKFNTENLVRYIGNYITKAIRYSFKFGNSGNANIQDIKINFMKDGKNISKFVIDSSTTFIDKDSVIYDLKFSINSVPSKIKLDCKDLAGKLDMKCKIYAENIAIESFFNQINMPHNLELSRHALLNIDGILDIDDGSIVYGEGNLSINNHFTLINTKNKNHITVSNAKSDFKVINNLQEIEFNNLVANLSSGDKIDIEYLRGQFLNPERLAIFDFGEIKFKAHSFPLKDLYYYSNIVVSEANTNKLHNIIDNIVKSENAIISPSGVLSWSTNFVEFSNGIKKDFSYVKNYDLLIKGSAKNANITSLNNILTSNLDLDIFIKPNEYTFYTKNAIFNNLKIQNTSLEYKNNIFNVKIEEKNQKIYDVIKLISSISGKNIGLNFLQLDQDAAADIKGEIILPMIGNVRKKYVNSEINFAIDIPNFKTKYFSEVSGLTRVILSKNKHTNLINTNIIFDKINFTNNQIIAEQYNKCNLSSRLYLYLTNDGKFEMIDGSLIDMICANKNLFNANFLYNFNGEYSLKIKDINFFDNDFSLHMGNDKNNLFYLKINGNKVNFEPFLYFVNSLSSSSSLEQKSDSPDDIKIKIKTDVVNDISGFFKKYFQKINGKKQIDSIDFSINIKDSKMFNGYTLDSLNGFIKINNKQSVDANIICGIKDDNKNEENYAIFTISDTKDYAKDIYIKISGIEKFITAISGKLDHSIRRGNLILKGIINKDGNMTGGILIKDLIYRRPDAKILKDIKLDGVMSDIYYDKLSNLLSFSKGEINGTGIIGNFDAKINFDTKYTDFLIYVALGGVKYGIADIPILGNLLTLSIDRNRYLAGFKYHLYGYYDKEVDGSLRTLPGASWLTGYLAMIILAFSGT